MLARTQPQALLPLIVADIYELAGRFRDSGEAIARTAGQTQARWQVMSAASSEPRTVPQIARRLGVSRQNVQRIADLLVDEGSAVFEPNPEHRGSPHLVLNKRGYDALAQLTARADADHKRLARRLAAHDIESLHRGLRLLVDATAIPPTEPPNPRTPRSDIMNCDTIRECMALSFADTPFPVVAQKLAGAGVRAYTADLIGRRKTYYGTRDESMDEALPIEASPIADRFDDERVAASLRAIQRGEIGYAQFLRQIMSAGCASYRVFIDGRKAIYFGHDGDCYVEPFPTTK